MSARTRINLFYCNLIFLFIITAGLKSPDRSSNCFNFRKKIISFKWLPESLLPAGYDLLDTTSGLLNEDEYEDLVIVAEKKTNCDSDKNDTCRLFLLFYGSKGKLPKLKVRNNTAILARSKGGMSKLDPFDNVASSKNTIIIHNSGGMGKYHWLEEIQFKYYKSKNDWYLDKIVHRDFDMEWATRYEGDSIQHIPMIQRDTVYTEQTKEGRKLRLTDFNASSR